MSRYRWISQPVSQICDRNRSFATPRLNELAATACYRGRLLDDAVKTAATIDRRIRRDRRRLGRFVFFAEIDADLTPEFLLKGPEYVAGMTLRG